MSVNLRTTVSHKMRLNTKRLTILSAIIFFLWLIFTLSSFIDVPKSISTNKNIVNIEDRIFRLEKELDKQLSDSGRLLITMKEHLKRTAEHHGKLKQTVNIENGGGPVLPVLVIACDRITVKRCLENLVNYRPNKETFPIIVSQDCGHNETYAVIKSFVDSDPSISVVQQPDLSEIPLSRPMVKFKGYYKIARHFKFALNHVLKTLGHEAVIIVEDDLDISPDFFEYFLGTYPLLHSDPSIWCISAWNDNGKKGLIDPSRPELLHRTDFFPGLGWMLTRESWLDIEPNWPEAFFDDWLRDPQNTGGRACIRPEISRTFSFGKIGVSKGLFFDMHLRYIQLNMNVVEFTKLNVSYLLKERYDAALAARVAALPAADARAAARASAAVSVPYAGAKDFRRAAKQLGLMDDFRSGIPRTAYKGIVTCYIKGHRVYLVPSFEWVKYDPTWG